MKKKKFLIFCSIFILFSLLPQILILADTTAPKSSPRGLEISYPPIPGATPPNSTAVRIEDYAKYLVYFLWAVTGILVVVVIVIAGFQYLSSAGRPIEMQEAKSRIFSALLGLVIMFLSVLLVMVINPNWVGFSTKPFPMNLPTLDSGILLCDGQEDSSTITSFFTKIDEIKNNTDVDSKNDAITNLQNNLAQMQEHCIWQKEAGNIPDNFFGVMNKGYIIPDPGKSDYGVVLYEYDNFNESTNPTENGKGLAQVELATKDEFHNNEVIPFNAGFTFGSVFPFEIDYNPANTASSMAALYEKPNFNLFEPDAKMDVFGGDTYLTSEDVSDIWEKPQGGSNSEISSIMISGKLLVLFTPSKVVSENDPTSDYDVAVFTSDNGDLASYKLGDWIDSCVEQKPDQAKRQYPCAKGMTIITLK